MPTPSPVRRLLLPAALSLAPLLFAPLSSASAAALWAGVDARTSGLAAHFGVAVLPIPFIGAFGIEGGAERGYGGNTTFNAGLTLRDLNLPFTAVDAFATAGVQFDNAALLYGEAGLRGPLIGPAGWRLSVRARQDGLLGAGAGLELRF